MENKYRESLRNARLNEAGAHPLCSSNWLYQESRAVKQVVENPVKEEALNLETMEGDQEVTEKTVILDSLNVFGQEKLEDNENFKFKGGELTKKLQTNSNNIHPLVSIQRDELIAEMSLIKADTVGFKKFSSMSSPIKIVFITDENLNEKYDAAEHLAELAQFFEFEVSNLFLNMIKAMRLEKNDYYVSSINYSEKENFQNLLAEVYFLKPELIITLGATASHKLLNSKERLKDSHGQISKMAIQMGTEEECSFNIMPLFSPKLLQTAPNMKRTAWKDMQKAMEFLNL